MPIAQAEYDFMMCMPVAAGNALQVSRDKNNATPGSLTCCVGAIAKHLPLAGQISGS
jgi:hypothetical protein